MQDNDLASVFETIPGVRVTHHYPGTDPGTEGNYYIHVTVNNKSNLKKLAACCQAVNCALMLYLHDNDFRYTVVVPKSSLSMFPLT